jgi:RNA polymerase sigma-70 factor (ECF subfamily)
MSGVGDEKLVRRAQAGSREAASALFTRHGEDTWRLAFLLVGDRADADDITQDAWERAFRGLSRFEGRSAFRTWIRRIVVNRASEYLRRERRRPDRVPLASDLADPQEDLAASAGEVIAAIRALSPDRRIAVVLHHWVGLTVADCASVLEVPAGTVQSRLARAMNDLRSTLGVTP